MDVVDLVADLEEPHGVSPLTDRLRRAARARITSILTAMCFVGGVLVAAILAVTQANIDDFAKNQS